MATGDSIYVDPSALLKLYLHQPESVAMNAWRAKIKGALPITHHGRVEVVNGICLAAHRQEINSEALADTLASFDEDFTLGLQEHVNAGPCVGEDAGARAGSFEDAGGR